MSKQIVKRDSPIVSSTYEKGVIMPKQEQATHKYMVIASNDAVQVLSSLSEVIQTYSEVSVYATNVAKIAIDAQLRVAESLQEMFKQIAKMSEISILIQFPRIIGVPFGRLVKPASLSVIARLVDLGIRPLYAQMEQVPPDKADIVVKGRGYKFDRFRRVRALKLEFDELE